ncbi:ZIP family metal transporter [Marimonas arenosa]|uniref:ZIP family metal transporter n=1 Tax=Marimonas arenosa TaxID=1795305 RepID=A0AAE4B486_9RHOB|nr:ZIP family metal transporter [Marimonas arenosa]MDQ2089975.1 ZIP family metal transporter [Marimonas arenosa]
MSIILQGFLGSLGAGLMTAVGAVPVLFGRSMSRQTMDIMLGFAAGVMLAATFFSLLGPSVEFAGERFGHGVIPAAVAVVGVLLGAGTVMFFDNRLPHEHFIVGREGPEAAELRRIWLFVFAITLHNAPEGMAVGVGFGGGDVAAGLQIALGIGVQNAPEGLAVAVALISKNYSRSYAFLIAALTGLVEPVAGLIAAVAVSLSAALLPWAMAFAAGAMLYVISHEIIPETHRYGHQRRATQGLLAGFVLMMALDVALG